MNDVAIKNTCTMIVLKYRRRRGVNLWKEKADAAAKSALSLSITPMKLPATNMLPRVMRLISEEWQEIWDCCAGVHAIIPTVCVYISITS